ncbi:50S ribosomal protein L16 [archaeon]|jgi:large subunit ribosomal protein L10e|nr:50S ribosomal protein L16 [archaeon]MBT6762565.1 50S ribosomal protein L16 [archaeon]
MAKLRKFVGYRGLERPYTRTSKFNKKNYIRGGFPNIKIVKYEMGDVHGDFDTTVVLRSDRDLNIRHNALEAARMTTNKHLEKALGRKGYFLKIRPYPFHVMRENPLASGAGADRMSTGMKKSFGKIIGAAARIKNKQIIMEVRIPKKDMKVAKAALKRASAKFPCSGNVKELGL